MLGMRVSQIVVSVVLAGLGSLAVLSPAQGQVVPPEVLTDANGYKYLKPEYDPALKGPALVKARSAYTSGLQLARKVLSGQTPLNSAKNEFDYFYIKYYFPVLTLTSDEALGELPLERQRLFRDLESCSSREVHDYARDLIFNQMKLIVQDNYHPVCRYNAMLIISSLNDVETVRIGANRTTPEPMVAALPFIYEQFGKADTDGVKMAALLGLLRHLEWDNFRGPVSAPTPAIPAPTRDAIVKDLVALALQAEPPKGREPLGHEWFRRRAIEGLAYANYLKVDPAAAQALQMLLKSETEPIAIRCAAATAIGQLPLQAPANVEIKPTTLELGYLALVACDRELARVAAQRKEDADQLTRLSGGSSYGSGSYGGGLGSDSPGYGGGSGGYPGDTEGGSGPRMAPGGRPGMMGGPGMRPGGSRIPGGSSTDGADGGYGYGSATAADPKQYRFDLIRRRLRAQLYAVEVGLNGPDPHARTRPGETPTGPPRGMVALAKGKQPEEKYVGDVQALVKKIADAVENADTDVTELEKDIRKHLKPLETATRKLVAPAPVEAQQAELPELPAGPPVPPAAGTKGPAAGAKGPARAANGSAAEAKGNAPAGIASDAAAAPDAPAPVPSTPATPAPGPAPVPEPGPATPAPMPPAAPPG